MTNGSDAYAPAGAPRETLRVPLSRVRPNPYQPRKAFSEASIAELADSIRECGLLSPLVVRRVGGDEFELIAGERRLRALKLLGLSCADALVLCAPEPESALIALIENLQREDLHFLDEAEAYRSLVREHGMTQEELARRLGRSPSSVANRLRLLRLSQAARARVMKAGLSERHARALLRLPDEPSRMRALDYAEAGMSVKSLEALIDKWLREKPAEPRVRVVCRDSRMYVNAVLNAVSALKKTCAAIESRVTDRDDCVEILVRVPKPAPK